MAKTLNPEALLIPHTDVRVGLSNTADGNGYVHVSVQLGVSRWNCVLPIGRIVQSNGGAIEQQEAD